FVVHLPPHHRALHSFPTRRSSDLGDIRVEGSPVPKSHLAYLAPGRDELHLEAITASRVVLIGGEPLGEKIVMWWNFIGRSHDERSEEHTSELQSRENLVCRLLLAK